MRRSVSVFFVLFLLVSFAGAAVLVRDPLKQCLEEKPGPRTACFQEIISAAAREGDFESAFRLVERAYALDTDYASNCHGSAHELGKIAYLRFTHGEESVFSTNARYCAYGFFHGFIEQLSLEDGRVGRAEEFCTMLGERLARESRDARGACFHGIGHGTVDGTDTQLWGKAHAMVREGTDMCERVAGQLPDEPRGTGPLFRCVTGAYNALEILSQEEKYDLHTVATDPLAFCLSEPNDYAPLCVSNMIPALLRIYDEDFTVIAQKLISLPSMSDDARKSLITDLFHEYVRLHLNDSGVPGRSGLMLCRTLGTHRLSCIEGIAGGQLKYGPPTATRSKILSLCESLEASDEREACFRYGLSRLRVYYAESEAKELCTRAPVSAQGICDSR